MIDPTLLTNAVVSTLQTNTTLVRAMGGEDNIQAYHYLYGAEHSLDEAIYKLTAPAILVAWEGTLSGNFDGMTIWKHKVGVYMRTANMAGVQAPYSYEHLWWLVVNGPVNNSNQNIRQIQILSDSNGSPLIDLMDTPGVKRMKDQDGLDFFCGLFVFPEIGDN